MQDNKCHKCGEKIECSMCHAQNEGVFVLSHKCPNAHKNCATIKPDSIQWFDKEFEKLFEDVHLHHKELTCFLDHIRKGNIERYMNQKVDDAYRRGYHIGCSTGHHVIEKAKELERDAIVRRLHYFWHDNYGMDKNGNEYVYKDKFDDFIESLSIPSQKTE